MIFREATRLLAKPQGLDGQRCEELPVYHGSNQCVSCWKASFGERLSILLHGRVWLGVYSPSGTQPPVWVEGSRTVFERSGRRMPWHRRLLLEFAIATGRAKLVKFDRKTPKTDGTTGTRQRKKKRRRR